MARIMSIDYGQKRTGIAVSDPLQMIANGLATIETKELEKFLTDYMGKEVAQGIAPDKALPAERDTAAVFPVALHCLEFLHNDYSQEPLRYLSLVTQKGEEKKS